MIWIMKKKFWHHTQITAFLDKKEVLEHINNWIKENIEDFSINDLDVFLCLEDSITLQFKDEKECFNNFTFKAEKIKLPKNKTAFCNLFNQYQKGK